MVATFVRSGYQNRARVRVEDPDLRRSVRARASHLELEFSIYLTPAVFRLPILINFFY